MPKLNNVDFFIQIGCQHMNMHYMDTNEYITMTMILSIIDQVCFDKCQKSGHHIQAARITQMNADARDIIAFFYKWMPTPVTRTLHNFHCHDHDCLQKSNDLITTTAFPLLRKRRSSKITVVRGVTRQSSFRNWQQGHLFSFALPSFSVILYLLAS